MSSVCLRFTCGLVALSPLVFPVRYEKIKFLVIALKNAVEVYAWAPKPYHKFMAFKVSNIKNVSDEILKRDINMHVHAILD